MGLGVGVGVVLRLLDRAEAKEVCVMVRARVRIGLGLRLGSGLVVGIGVGCAYSTHAFAGCRPTPPASAGYPPPYARVLAVYHPLTVSLLTPVDRWVGEPKSQCVCVWGWGGWGGVHGFGAWPFLDVWRFGRRRIGWRWGGAPHFDTTPPPVSPSPPYPYHYR